VCTLIIGRDVLGPRTMVLGANRDEDPARRSDPPGVLSEQPRVVGGRDLVALGTWLAVRDGEAAIALLNRWAPGASVKPGRSRGLLALDVAIAPREVAKEGVPLEAALGDDLATASIQRAWSLVASEAYAPFTLVFASARSCWIMVNTGEERPRVTEVPRGWHALTHSDLDDAREPRTAYLCERLADLRPTGLEEAEVAMMALLRSHGESGEPPVCLHQGRMMTVSSSLIWMEEGGVRYLHAEGRPCEREFVDYTPLARPLRTGVGN
jgi:hypothetical protein